MKIGIIGLGARISHVAGLLVQAMPEAAITCYTDPADPPAGLRFIETDTNKLTAYTDPADMLATEKPDLVMIGSPNYEHLGHLRTALESDIPYIFVEKPVVISEEETFTALELLGKHNGHERVLVGLVLRYSPLFRALEETVKAGRIGEIVSVEACELIPPHHGRFFMRDWRRHTRLSGGFMLEKCVHDLDLYQSLIGARPLQVASFGGRKTFIPANRPPEGTALFRPEIKDRVDPYEPRWQGIEQAYDSDGDIIDFQTAMIQFENGTALNFHTNLNAPDELRGFTIIGTRGMARGDFVKNNLTVHDALTAEKMVDVKDVSENTAGHYGADEAMAHDLKECLQNGKKLPVSIFNALEAGLTALKIDESRHKGKITELAPCWEKFDRHCHAA